MELKFLCQVTIMCLMEDQYGFIIHRKMIILEDNSIFLLVFIDTNIVGKIPFVSFFIYIKVNEGIYNRCRVRIKRGTCVRDFIMCQAMLAFLL
jgi:hypothetical protein